MKREFDDDDGETIVDMNVDGMPWYDRRGGGLGWFGRPPASTAARRDDAEAGSPEEASGSGGAAFDGVDEPTKEQVRAYRHAAIKASLLVVAVFAGVFAAFIAFCDFVLFR